MNKDNKSITITDWHGKQEVLTRLAYIGKWTDHVREFRHLIDDKNRASSKEEFNKIHSIVSGLAAAKFDKILKRENEDS